MCLLNFWQPCYFRYCWIYPVKYQSTFYNFQKLHILFTVNCLSENRLTLHRWTVVSLYQLMWPQYQLIQKINARNSSFFVGHEVFHENGLSQKSFNCKFIPVCRNLKTFRTPVMWKGVQRSPWVFTPLLAPQLIGSTSGKNNGMEI